MKKILIATTALIATTGVAAAEVAVSGNGRMGVVYNGTDLNFSSRIRVVFTASGETDGGLSFGGTFRADNAGNAAAGAAGNIFISGAFGKIAMGDVVGAAEAVIGDLPEIGYTDIAANDITYITGDGKLTSAGNPVLLYTYTAGYLTFAASFNDGNNASSSVTTSVATCPPPPSESASTAPVVCPITSTTTTTANTTQEFAIGVKYALGDYAVALGYEDNGTVTHYILGADATFGDTAIKAFYGKASDLDFTQYGLGVTYKADALTIKGLVQSQKTGSSEVISYGIGAAYALGGGATIEGGIADNDVPGSDPVADIGIKFTF